MIEALEKKKLIKYGFDTNTIQNIFKETPNNYTLWGEKFVIASSVDGKIYTDIDAAKKYWFGLGNISFPITHPDLIEEYYSLKLEKWLTDKKNSLGEMFNEQKSIERFNQSEIELTKECINYQLEKFKRKRKNEHIEIYQSYIDFLEANPQAKKSNPLKLIDENILSLFIEAEKKATNNTLKFTSEIRCAAFCELLFLKNYFTTKYDGKKQDRIIQKDFAFSRYGITIKTGFNASKKAQREKHINNKIDGLLPLRNCF